MECGVKYHARPSYEFRVRTTAGILPQEGGLVAGPRFSCYTNKRFLSSEAAVQLCLEKAKGNPNIQPFDSAVCNISLFFFLSNYGPCDETGMSHQKQHLSTQGPAPNYFAPNCLSRHKDGDV